MVMMGTRTFHKSSRRVVRSTLSRFVSLMIISFLGAGVFAGLWAVSPNMTRVGDEYYSSQNVHDVRLLSTYGFTDADVDAVSKADGVKSVMASHYIDASGSVGEKDYTFRVDGLPSDAGSDDEDYINRVELVEGRLPTSDDECVIVEPSTGLKGIGVGSTISLSSESNDKLDESLSNTTLKVVGVVKSADYISFMVGSTSVGSGSIDFVLYTPDGNFTVDGYTDLYVTVDGASSLDQFRQAYLDKVGGTTASLEEVKEKRQTLRYDTLWDELNQAWDEYRTSKASTEQTLSQALGQLSDGASKIATAKSQYQSGLEQYEEKSASASSQLSVAQSQLQSAASQISSGQGQIDSKESEYASAASQLSSARSALDDKEAELAQKKAEYQSAADQLASARSQLDEATGQYQQGLSAYQQKEQDYEEGESQYQAAVQSLAATRQDLDAKQTAYQQALAQAQAMDEGDERDAALAQLEQTRAQLDAAEEGYSEAKSQLDAKASELASAKQQLDAAKSQLDATKEQIDQGETDYSAKAQQLSQAKAQIDAAEAAISSAEGSYSEKASQLSQARSQLDAAETKLSQAKASYQEKYQEYVSASQSASSQLSAAKEELDSAKEQIEQAEAELAQKQAQYDDAKSQADQALSDAYDELTQKQSDLESMGDPKWYAFDRTKNEGYVMYKNDVERMEDLATVFPLIYFVVAALVCLTAMTRMVEEDRTLIGTFKALGFSNRTIAGRYLLYAGVASVTGGTIGTLVGFQLIPSIIWGAYGIAYTLPELHPAVYVGIGAASVAAMCAVTLLATLATVMGSLRETPASLMRPKAPRSGKRVLLEYVRPLWRRLSFTQKVTFRNLFLNKRRLLTSLVGIAGCTALVVAACGSYARVNTISSDQFDGVWHYDATVGYDTDDSTAVSQVLSDKSLVSDSAVVSSEAAEAAQSSGASDTKDITVVCPQDSSSIGSLITMYDPDTGSDVQFGDDSVVITEKLSIMFGVHAGDKIWVKFVTDDSWHELTVTAVTRNYTMNYVYVGKSAYQKAFGSAPTFDRSLVRMADGVSTSELSKRLDGVDGVSFVSLTSDTAQDINTSISSVNTIVLVLVISSGLLAFVVIYNLTTINVAERQREIATLKVLGFYERECNSYILREIWLTAAMGIAIGLWLGSYLYDAILATVEPDVVLLLRTVTPASYLAAAALMVAFTWIVNQCVKPSIRGIDMLESLKSVE